jgi:Sterile alpha motif (SAM)/Pointed domain
VNDEVYQKTDDTQSVSGVCIDPAEWSSEQVSRWLHWMVGQNIDVARAGVDIDKLATLSGRQLSRLGRDDFVRLTRHVRVGEALWSSFNLLLRSAAAAAVASEPAQPPPPPPPASDPSALLSKHRLSESSSL